MRFATYRLADDREEYGGSAGQWIVVTEDGEREVTGPNERAGCGAFCRLPEHGVRL